MNEKCKYCDYVSECSRKCEYDSILCKINRSFPKVVDKSYEQLQQENKHLDGVNCKLRRKIGQLEDNWNKLKEWIEGNWIESQDIWFVKIINKMQELEQGSDKE